MDWMCFIFLLKQTLVLFYPTPTVFLLAAASLLCSSCQQEKRPVYRTNLDNKSGSFSMFKANETARRRIDLTQPRITDRMLVSDLIQVEKIIPLDTAQPIGTIEKLLLLPNGILVFDKSVHNMLSLFDRQGTFITRVGNSGEGPNEFIHLSDVQYNPFRHTIDAWDESGQKMLQYRPDGSFESAQALDIFASHFAPLSATDYLFYKGSGLSDPALNTRFITVDIGTHKVRSKDFPILPFQENLHFEPGAILRYNRYTRGYFFNENHENTVYQFTPGRLEKRAFIDFGRRAIQAEDLDFKRMDAVGYFQLLTKPGLFTSIHKPMETADVFLFQFAQGKKMLTCMYDKRSKKAHVVERFYDDVFGHAFFFNPIDTDERGRFVFVLDPLLIREAILRKSETTGIPAEQLIEQLRQTQPQAHRMLEEAQLHANPILLFAHLNLPSQ